MFGLKENIPTIWSMKMSNNTAIVLALGMILLFSLSLCIALNSWHGLWALLLLLTLRVE